MADPAPPFIVPPGDTRREVTMPLIKAVAADTDGAATVVEGILGSWESGPPLHRHATTDEAFYVATGVLEVQIIDDRHQVPAGGFAWIPRGTPHAFANAGSDDVHVLTLAIPGGIEDFFVEQEAQRNSVEGPPDPAALSEIAARHGVTILGPPIRARNAPVEVDTTHRD